LIGAAAHDVVEVKFCELDDIVRSVRDGASIPTIVRAMDRLKAEPTRVRFERIAEQARALAERLGKGVIDVDIVSNNVRLSPDRWKRFWSTLTHVIRNAVDHGIETDDERQALHKRVTPRIALSSEIIADRVIINIVDDGRGVDWNKLRERCRQRGLPCETEGELIEAIFVDGISTKESTSEISGRGVGMAAVRAACFELGGTVSVESAASIGTKFTFSVPSDDSVAAPEASRQALVVCATSASRS
jgi:two-component system chemotaxis sensor kinase CheA